ncbi:DEAD/DEAH box helicase [Plasmodium cynomolgi strain B]|uniref:DEAD/DEAH box helicase n=1 Tax=Plasmodium cynomolgi (strain B) TaxID=1120755 RepID=K6UMW1_PLACD|nr:DEAD/DEAH box helicase [Plasmodium cynomolgi strain B]GAB68948.1 DEAD/DEAH box helicase [Plasmodium cynomolgi strain B]
MNYGNNNMNAAGFNEGDDDRNTYVRNNFMSNMNESPSYNNQGNNMQMEENPNAHMFNQMRNKREVSNNVMTAGGSGNPGNRNFYEGNVNNDGYMMGEGDNFDDAGLNLHEILLSNIKKVNYDKTTPIQKYSLSIIMNKNDLIGVAQTGSGKTAGYLLPIINHMLLNDPPKHTFYEENQKSSSYYYNRVCLPICLILAPTRELAVQIFYDSKKFCFETGIKPVVLYGGSNIKTQLSNLDKGADIIVATPGRLNDILEKGKIRLFLTSFLVLDEADRMLDMGFSPQIRSIMYDYDMPGNDNDSRMNPNKMEYKRYTNDIVKRQTIMFSATFRKEIQSGKLEVQMNISNKI